MAGTLQKIREALKADPQATAADLAGRIGCSRFTVYSLAKKYGLQVQSDQRGRPPQVESEEESDYLETLEQFREAAVAHRKTFREAAIKALRDHMAREWPSPA